jgi:putative ABC transport system permease protein
MEIRPILSALLRSKTGAVLIAAQVALTLAILTNATFVVRTRLATADRPSGADEANVFDLSYVGSRKITDREAMVQRDVELLRAIPGVASVSTANMMPLGQSGWQAGVTVDPTRPDSSGLGIGVYMGDALVETFGLRLVDGRNFAPEEIRVVDEAVSARAIQSDAVIVTRHVAQVLFPTEKSVVGKTIYFGTGPTATPLRIVGVVDTLMTPWAQASADAYDSIIIPQRLLSNRASYAIRAEPGQRDRVMAAAEAALTPVRADRVLVRNRPTTQARENRYKRERVGAGMLIAVSIGLLLVTGSGIVGVASLWVSQRRKQIGVRRALGAGRLDILRYFVTENLLITTAGVAAGVALAVGLNQLLVSRLELPRLPVVYLVGGVIALWTLGIVAVLGPAWRAAAVPPAVATRGA